MHLLCVDDDPVMLEFFKDAFTRIGVPDDTLATAMTGAEAIEIVKNQRIDLVILDNKLPDISGLETLRRIKETKPRTEVMIVTGFASIETAVEAMKAGARDFISKPFHLALLHEKMRNIIDLLQREREAEDFRFAKEMLEHKVHEEITSLEEMIGAMRSCQACVIEILDSSRDDGEKVALIRQMMHDFGRAQT